MSSLIFTVLTKKATKKGTSMNTNMKVSEHCKTVASRGEQVFGIIETNIIYREKGLIVD